jgi:predicted site-specific integrase-resolvase
MKVKITLKAWAQGIFSPPPDIATLRRWARDGLICPAPEKVGRTWYVEKDAVYRQPASGEAANDAIPSGISDRAASILMAA